MTEGESRVTRLRAAEPRDDALPDYITLTEIVGFLRRFRSSIAVSLAIPVACAAIYILTASPVYTARAQILLDPRTPQPLRDNADTSSATFDSPYVESQIAVLKSEGIALAVARDLKLYQDAEFAGAFVLPTNGSDAPGRANDGKDFERQRAIVFAMVRSLDIQRTGSSYAIDINFTSRNPDKAATIANAIAAAFVKDQLDNRSETIQAGGRWLEQRIDELRKQMNAAAIEVQKFKLKRDYRIVEKPHSGALDAGTSSSGGQNLPPTLEDLESTAQTYRRIYESYLQAYTESLQKQSLPVANARVITPATRLLSPSAPKKALIMGLAVLIGLLLGLSQALLRSHFVPQSRP